MTRFPRLFPLANFKPVGQSIVAVSQGSFPNLICAHDTRWVVQRPVRCGDLGKPREVPSG